MSRATRAAIARACIAGALAVVSGTAALAGQSADTSGPGTPNPIVGGLRTIGRARAVSPYCKAFATHASAAIDSAVAFEAKLLETLQDFRYARRDSFVGHAQSLERMERDVRELADLAQAGRDGLTTLPAATDAVDDQFDDHDAVVAFRDALDGAKGRQLEIARKLGATAARFAEVPPSSIVNPVAANALVPQHATDALARRALANSGDAVDFFGALESDDAAFLDRSDLFTATVPDELVGRDLTRAAAEGIRVVTDAHC